MPTSREDKPKANRGPAAGPANRRALIDAARAVYSEEGLSAPFSAIAKRAGVGQGSLYRHFPDRTALAVAVFDDNVTELEALALPEGHTLDDLLDGVVSQAIASTALIELVTANLHDPRVQPLGERFRGIVTVLVAREHAAERLGAHIDVDDVLLATGMLATELARTEPRLRTEVARRARALFAAAFAPR